MNADPVKPRRSRTDLLISAAGLIATFYAVVLNLVTIAPASVLAAVIQALVFAVIAIACGIYCFRKGAAWRFIGIAMIGPSVFILAESGMRLIYFLQHGKGI